MPYNELDNKYYYILMRKNTPITVTEIDDNGHMLRFSPDMDNLDEAPLQSKIQTDWLREWWHLRAAPVSQKNIRRMLEENGISCPEEYLLRNLGISLTDYYWMKPLGSDLTWEDVNLFDNDFRGNLSFSLTPKNSSMFATITPNSSLQGQLEKTWLIAENGDRILVKGNPSELSSESIGEIVATGFHRLQGYDNYTPYDLMHVKDRGYVFACCSKNFADQRNELVSAYSIVTSEKKPNDISMYEHFIRICTRHGMDESLLRADMDYQIMADFILTNVDRHLNNVSVLRDADSLHFLRMAPIYDSGNCLFARQYAIDTDNLDCVEVNSFASTEQKMLSYVRDRSLVDVSKLPSPEYIRSLYEKDPHMPEERLDSVICGYEKKIDMFRDFQLGRGFGRYSRSIHGSADSQGGTDEEGGADEEDIGDI